MLRKKIVLLSSGNSSMDNMRTGMSYLGKKVFSKSGNKLGKVNKIMLKNNQFAGFVITGKKLFIDKEYIGSESDKAVMLSIDPVTELVGKQVIDSEGKKVGKVQSVSRRTNANNFSELVVKKNPFSKPFLIKKEDIEVLKESVILNRKV